MVQAFALLLACQLAGEGLAYASALPVPGPVIGLVLLATGLAVLGARPVLEDDGPLARTANGLLGHLSLLFVPAAVGIVQQGGALLANGAAVAAALVVSTLATLAVTAGVFAWAARRVTSGGAGR